MDLASIFRQSLELWQNPAETELPEETFINIANRCLTQRNIDLDLTPDACFFTIKSDTFTFADSTSREADLEDLGLADDISRITRVESRSQDSTSEDDWTEETMASFDNWNDVMERGDDNFCAVYGTHPNLKLVVNRDVSDLEFRLVHRVMQTKITTTDTVLEIPAIYEPVLIYDIALEMGEVIDNNSPEFMKKKAAKMPYLEARLKDTIERIDKWRRSQTGTSVTRRRAFNDRQPVFSTNRKRFTINFPG
jgi:hypothetical protein